MTLCIARRINKYDVELASDSRISIGPKHFDTGIKVFAIPVVISFPRSDDEEEEDKKPTFTYGLAVAGDTLHAYLVKEAIAELLHNLQYIPGHTDLSIIRLCDVVLKVFIQLAQDIDGARGAYQDVVTGFFLTGYCPDKDQVRAFKFKTSRSPVGILGGKYEEILNEEKEIQFMGTGEAAALKVYNQHPKWHSLWIMDEVIRNGGVASVGGKPQYGSFHAKYTFYISGIVDYFLNEDGILMPKMFLRGVDIYEDEFKTGTFNYWISYQFREPFREDIIDSWNTRYPNDQFIR